MGATSTTGTGTGGVDKPGYAGKGRQGMNVSVDKLIGPRVVISQCCLELDSNGEGTAYFPTLPGTVDDYCVFLSTQSSTHAYWGGFTTSSFGVTGGANDSVCWQVVKNGIWGSPVSALENT